MEDDGSDQHPAMTVAVRDRLELVATLLLAVGVVLTAWSAGLFFAGVSSKFESARSRRITVAVAILIVVVGLAVLSTFPVEI